MKKIILVFLAMLIVMSCSTDEAINISVPSTPVIDNGETPIEPDIPDLDSWETFIEPELTIADYEVDGIGERETKIVDLKETNSEGLKIVGATRGVITDVRTYGVLRIQSKNGYLVGYENYHGIDNMFDFENNGTFMSLDINAVINADPTLAIGSEILDVCFYNPDDIEKITPISRFRLIL